MSIALEKSSKIVEIRVLVYFDTRLEQNLGPTTVLKKIGHPLISQKVQGSMSYKYNNFRMFQRSREYGKRGDHQSPAGQDQNRS